MSFHSFDAFPLPPQPNLEQYKKRAKELVKACKSGDPARVKAWTTDWLESMARLQEYELTPRVRQAIDRRVDKVAQSLHELLNQPGRSDATCTLADAQFLMARWLGFESWPKLAKHLAAAVDAQSPASAFETAVDAIVAGNDEKLGQLLSEYPNLVHARSTRGHGCTLLHYTAANGVEGYRQETPKNIVAITRLLLEAGAEVDAIADLYGGGSTTLGLAATSVHPFRAGVQNDLLQVLLDYGADIDAPQGAGNNQHIVLGCMANGRGEAAIYLAQQGAKLNLESAAGVGRLDVVRSYFNDEHELINGASREQLSSAFLWASGYGQTDVVEYLLAQGVDLTATGPQKQTALHWAGMFHHADVVKLLLKHQAPLEIENEFGGTALDQTLWSAAHGRNADAYVPVIELLLDAGGKVPPGIPPISPAIDELLTRHGSPPDPKGYWYGEKPPG
jgi:ankyrin repeat protein